MKKYFMFLACALLTGALFVSCGDDEEVVVERGMDFDIHGMMTMTVLDSIMGPIEQEVEVKATSDNSAAMIELDGFESPSIVQVGGLKISLTEIILRNVALTDNGRGAYELSYKGTVMDKDAVTFRFGPSPAKSVQPVVELTGSVSADGSKASLHYTITGLGSMPFPLKLDFTK